MTIGPLYNDMINDVLTYYAGSVKSLGPNKVGGYLVLFTDAENPDLSGEYFDKDTDFYGLEDGDKAVTLWHHNLDDDLQGPIGKGFMKKDDIGIWYEAQLSARASYEARVKDIMKLVDDGKVGFSSGSPGHLVKRVKTGDSYYIKAWQIAEASLTCTPCEPKTMAVPLKSLVEPKGRTLSDHTTNIIADLDAYVARIRGYVAMKVQDNRPISKDKRDALQVLYDDLKAILVETEPRPSKELVAMKLRLLKEKLSQPA